MGVFMSGLFAPIVDEHVQRLTIKDLVRTEKPWPMLTAYDASTARTFDDAGVPVLLVGDSAAMVVYGYDTTIPITVDELLPLVKAVVRGSRRAVVVADLPFGSYEESPEAAIATAVRFIKEGGVQAIKIEGGAHVVPHVQALVAHGIPVMGHIGLTPQSVHQFGGYRVQGRGTAGDALIEDAKALEAAGAFAIVVEVVPADLIPTLRQAIRIPVIGIGAGIADAQVLVWQDLVGYTNHRTPKFVKKYADVHQVMTQAVNHWALDVESKVYPDADHEYR
jgi:3-methyl-2-oxobutanoate hydroxymethyltransferase